MMPFHDGFELLRELRNTPQIAGIPVIFLTARVAKAEIREGMDMGADDYITKPFRMADLLRTVDARLLKHQLTLDGLDHERAYESSQLAQLLPHEINTPVSGVLGMTALLKSDLEQIPNPPPDSREMLDIIQSSAKRLHRLGQNLSLHYQLYSARRDINACPMLGQKKTSLVHSLLTSTALNVASEHNRTADLRITLASDLSFAGCPDYLAKAFYELIDNAFKFSLRGSPVTVELKRENQNLLITITDQGSGVTVDQCKNMSALCQYGRDTREQQGMGLGFSIAKRLIEFENGSLVISPQEGGGTIVSARLLAAGPVG
jgi:signal transduction histidine kinase